MDININYKISANYIKIIMTDEAVIKTSAKYRFSRNAVRNKDTIVITVIGNRELKYKKIIWLYFFQIKLAFSRLTLVR